MAFMSLFSREKKSRYAERVMPSDVAMPGINNHACAITGQESLDFFSMPKHGLFAVNETTSMRVAAVYGCVEKISVISTLPKHIYERTPNGDVKIDHDYWPLLNTSPNDTWTASSMWERNIASMLLRGDGLCKINRPNGSLTGKKITSITPYLRDNTAILRGNDGSIAYRFTDPYTGKQETALPHEVLHFPGFGFNGYCGMSVIQYAARSGIGISLSADESNLEFYSNGQRPDYIITSPDKLNEQQKTLLKETIASSHQGLGNKHKPMVLWGGMDVKPLSLTAEDAQMIETQGFQVVNICIAFGVPPQLIGAKDSTAGWAGSSLEQLNLGFAKYTLKQHINRLEQELNRKLFPGSDGRKYYVKFNLDAFLEGDSRTQAEYFNKALGGPGAQGWMTVNEVRKLKNLPPDANTEFDAVIQSGSLANTNSMG